MPLQLPWSVICFTLPLAAVGSFNLLYHCFLFWLWVAATVTVVSERFTYHWILKLDHCCYAVDCKLILSSGGDLVSGFDYLICC